ncbi:MAG: hypothetical protein RL632_2280 [Bacteroidota bacterium]
MNKTIFLLFFVQISFHLTAQFNFDTIIERTTIECVKCSNAELNEYLFEKVNGLEFKIKCITDSIIGVVNNSESFTKKDKKQKVHALDKLNKSWNQLIILNCEVIDANNKGGTQYFYFKGLMKVYLLEIQFNTLVDLCDIIIET